MILPGKYVIKFLFIAVLVCSGCHKLQEEYQGDLSQSQVGGQGPGNTSVLLQSLYNTLQSVFTNPLIYFPLQELCTDEAIAPTRGTNWDDNGVWRVIHQQKWLSNNAKISECFNSLNGIVFAATDLLQYHPKKQEAAEARFIRAWAMYLVLDLFDQVPYRDPGESLLQPARVRKGLEALAYIIHEIKEVEMDLPAGPIYRANQFAAKTLLMKCYLNKAVYRNRKEPVPEKPEMDSVISLADEIINSGIFSFSAVYFDNFAPGNSLLSRENIFTLLNDPGATSGNNLFLEWIIVFHYNQAPAANGWATLSDFYNKFESADKRKGEVYSTADSPPNPAGAVNIGFLAGQQYDYFTGQPLTDQTGAPLIFTPEVKNLETGANLEVTGIRPLKYFPDWANYFSPGNDFVFFRLPDVLLMKAEAIKRGGTGTNAGPYGNTATSIINAIRTDPSRNAGALTTVTLDDIYDERGRELWWEGWRRQDMIRFGKFLQPFQEKNYVSDAKYLLFPVPEDQLLVNPNLVLNPGY